MTSEYGAATQLEKINMLDLAELVAINKFDKEGSLDALRDVRKLIKRNRGAWDLEPESMPVYPTIASQFNDRGVNHLFKALVNEINDFYQLNWDAAIYTDAGPAEDIQSQAIIPGKRQRYLSEVSEAIRDYHSWSDQQVEVAQKLDQVEGTLSQVDQWEPDDKAKFGEKLKKMREHWLGKLDSRCRNILDGWDELYDRYRQEHMDVQIRDNTFRNKMFRESLSGLQVPRVALPKTRHRGERLQFALKENLPGYFPFTSGGFPFKQEGEDPTRMFAVEGSRERTNTRFPF